MKKSLLFVLIAAAILAAACQPAPTQAPATQPAEVPTEAPTAVPTEAPVEPTEAPAEATRPAGDTITITDAAGREVTVPVNPQRIVALSEQDADAAIALSMPLVGLVNGRGSTEPPAYLQSQLGDAISVGSLAEPSVETILSLQPDLILFGAVSANNEGLIPTLSEIAPTVVTYAAADSWDVAFRNAAAAMNRSAEAETWITDVYQARIADVQAAIEGTSASTISIVRFNPDGPVMMAYDSFSSRIIRDLGFDRPEAQQSVEGFSHSDTISQEALAQIDGDLLFVASLNPEGATTLEAALADPIYQAVPVVNNGNTHVVDGGVWTSRGGPLAALVILDDIRSAITE